MHGLNNFRNTRLVDACAGGIVVSNRSPSSAIEIVILARAQRPHESSEA
jgi:hypothetical protein